MLEIRYFRGSVGADLKTVADYDHRALWVRHNAATFLIMLYFSIRYSNNIGSCTCTIFKICKVSGNIELLVTTMVNNNGASTTNCIENYALLTDDPSLQDFIEQSPPAQSCIELGTFFLLLSSLGSVGCQSIPLPVAKRWL